MVREQTTIRLPKELLEQLKREAEGRGGERRGKNNVDDKSRNRIDAFIVALAVSGLITWGPKLLELLLWQK